MHENGSAASGFLYFIAAINTRRDFLLARRNLISWLARAIIAPPTIVFHADPREGSRDTSL